MLPNIGEFTGKGSFGKNSVNLLVSVFMWFKCSELSMHLRAVWCNFLRDENLTGDERFFKVQRLIYRSTLTFGLIGFKLRVLYFKLLIMIFLREDITLLFAPGLGHVLCVLYTGDIFSYE